MSLFALLQRTYRSFIEGFFYYLGAAVGLVWINESQSKVGDIGANIFMVTLIWMVAKGKLNETFFKWHYIRPFITRGVVASISPVIVVYACTWFFYLVVYPYVPEGRFTDKELLLSSEVIGGTLGLLLFLPLILILQGFFINLAIAPDMGWKAFVKNIKQIFWPCLSMLYVSELLGMVLRYSQTLVNKYGILGSYPYALIGFQYFCVFSSALLFVFAYVMLLEGLEAVKEKASAEPA